MFYKSIAALAALALIAVTPASAQEARSLKSCGLGDYKTGGKCKNCPAGTYQDQAINDAGLTSCKPCAEGTFSSWGAATCSDCAKDTISDDGAETCTPCKNGGTTTGTKTTITTGCTCPTGYLGADCNSQCAANFAAVWKRTDSTSDTESESAVWDLDCLACGAGTEATGTSADPAVTNKHTGRSCVCTAAKTSAGFAKSSSAPDAACDVCQANFYASDVTTTTVGTVTTVTVNVCSECAFTGAGATKAYKGTSAGGKVQQCTCSAGYSTCAGVAGLENKACVATNTKTNCACVDCTSGTNSGQWGADTTARYCRAGKCGSGQCHADFFDCAANGLCATPKATGC